MRVDELLDALEQLLRIKSDISEILDDEMVGKIYDDFLDLDKRIYKLMLKVIKELDNII